MQYLLKAKRSLLILGFSLMTLGANQLSVLAQTRQPTNVELSKLRQELQKAITLSKKNNSTFIQDGRTSKEKQDRESFVRAWSKVEPGLAPFFGSWTGYDLTEYIYPSNIKGRVCVIHSNEGYGGFSTGILSNGVIQTSRGEVIIKEGNYLGSALLEKGRFVRNYDAPLNSPKLLETVSKVEISDSQQKNTIVDKFKSAGCILHLPNSSAKSQIQNNKQITNEKPSLGLIKKLISIILKDSPGINSENWSDYKPPFSFVEIDLNGDKKKETIVVFRIKSPPCNNRHCPAFIFNTNKNKETYNLISEIFTVRTGSEIAILPTKNYGWYDLAAPVFTYQPREVNWRVFRFNGKKYELREKKLNSEPKMIILSESSREFDLGDFPKK